MRHIVASLKDSKISLSYIQKDGFSSISAEVAQEILSGSTILDPEALSGIIKDLLIKMGSSTKNADISFVADSSDVFLRFVTVPKHTEDLDAQIVTEARQKFSEISLEESYFAYEKIAPYVYQFIAVKKNLMEAYLKLADFLGMPILTITPWVSALPKYVSTNDAAIFIVGEKGPETVALSELGGIFFSDRYSFEDKKFDLEKTVKDLSVYRRDRPITRIYSLNYPVPEIEHGYTVSKIEFNLGEGTDISGFEYNLLVHFVIDANADLDTATVNLLNLLPLPAIQKAPVSLVKVGSGVAGVAALIALVLVVTGVIGGAPKNEEALASNPTPNDTAVLSTQDNPESTSSQTPEPPVNLNKENLKIRVENGSGINGIAAKTKTLLEGKTYKVTEIDTADETRDTTLLRFKKASIAYQDLVKTDLDDAFGTIVFEDSLSEESPYDLLIIIGTGVSL